MILEEEEEGKKEEEEEEKKEENPERIKFFLRLSLLLKLYQFSSY